MPEPKDLALSERRAAATVSRFATSPTRSSNGSGALPLRTPPDSSAVQLALAPQRPPWRVFQFALLLAAFLLAAYGATTKSWTLFTVEALVGTATLSVGGLLGFLFGIPRTTRPPRGSEGAGANDGRREAINTPYEPSNNLEQVADWLTKILVGVGLVE